MKLVNTNGGHSIGVYNSETKDKSKVFRMLDEKRIKYYVPADYNENSQLEQLVKMIIDRTISNEMLEEFYFECVSEKDEEIKGQSEETIKIDGLINRLEDSMSFANTHDIIAKLRVYKLVKIALNNNQVTYILKDKDVKKFYEAVCKNYNDDDARKVIAILNSK